MKNVEALVLTPMDSSYKRIRDTIQRSLRDSGVSPIQIDEIFQPGAQWANAVTDAIQEADFIVADVSRKNPNVLYELGFAHALRKPTLLMLSTDAVGEMPFDLAGYQMVTYDPGNLTSLRDQIVRFVKYQESRWSKENA
jgi:nucleoside 2-deoxyribosyltransferase